MNRVRRCAALAALVAVPCFAADPPPAPEAARQPPAKTAPKAAAEAGSKGAAKPAAKAAPKAASKAVPKAASQAAPSAVAQAAAKPSRGPDDLTVVAVRHVANCPSPRAGGCVIRKPVDAGYRVLTAGVDLDDKGDYWIADFSKAIEAGGTKLLLRVIGAAGDLHEIEVTFPNEPARKASAPKK